MDYLADEVLVYIVQGYVHAADMARLIAVDMRLRALVPIAVRRRTPGPMISITRQLHNLENPVALTFPTLCQMARSYAAVKGRHQDAEDLYRAALALRPNTAIHIMLDLAALLKDGNTDREIVLWRQIVHLRPNSAHYIGCLASALLKKEEYKEAEETYMKALVLAPNSIWMLMNVAYIKNRDWPGQDFPGALAFYNTVLAIDPGHAEAKEGLAYTQFFIDFPRQCDTL